MTIVILIVYLLALVACVVAPKVWHRATMLIVMGILTYFVCSSMITVDRKVSAAKFWHHHSYPLKSFLAAVRSDVSTGNTNEAMAKLDTVISQSDSFAIYNTNVTMRTINQKLEISEQHLGQVSPEPAPSAVPDEPSR